MINMKTYKMEDIRNIAVMGHGKCGKTTLTEAMLYNAGATDRLGKVMDGTTTTDSDSNSDRTVTNTTTTSKPVTVTVDGKEQPLVISKSPAKIEGIVVVAQGGDDVSVKIDIIDALCALLDVDGSKIKVYKMK